MSVQEASAVNGVNNFSGVKETYSQGTSSLGKDDFLKLLTAQLSHQDPLDPMEDREFIAQMASFSELEQMTNLNTTMTNLANGQVLSQYAPLVGKNVEGIDTNGEPLSGTVNSI